MFRRYASKLQFISFFFIFCILTACQTQNKSTEELYNYPIATISVPALPTSMVVEATPISTLTSLVATPTSVSTPIINLPFYEQDSILYEERGDIYLSIVEKIDEFVIKGNLWIENPQAISPDHRKIIINVSNTTNVKMAILDIETKDLVFLSSLGITGKTVLWSYDGLQLGYVSSIEEGDKENYYLNYYSLKTKDISQYELPANTTVAKPWGWSFDDQYFALQLEVNGQSDLYIFDNLTKNLEQITNNPDIELATSWSPKQHVLLIGSNPNPSVLTQTTHPYEKSKVFLMDIEKSETILLENLDVTTFAWHPDGTQIVYSYGMGKLCFLSILNGESFCPQYYNFPVEEYAFAFEKKPVWSPDGEWLILEVSKRNSESCPMIYYLDLKSEKLIQTKREICFRTNYYWIGQ